MIVECQNCCAPLDVNASSTFVKCSYCGLTNKVRSLKTLSAMTPADWRPPVEWRPPPGHGQQVLHYTAAAGAATAGMSGCAIAIVAFALIAVLGGAAAAFVLLARTSTPLAPSWDGAAPLRCGGNERVHVEHVIASLPRETAITVTGNCELELVGCSITAWEGVAVNGNGRVVLRDSTIVTEGNGVTARMNANVELHETRISAAGYGIESHGNVNILAAGGRIAGTPQAVSTTRNVDLDVRGAELADGVR